ncbi:uncharacterized protein LOC122079772 isoform X1 [Macadamia integrifolia]|uniref:uncharacterized protein LOC122079772 isoform X1 n=1 Tax=Macadamia integrifolia TaxID=60698 RepID=UPI001C4F6ECD|nr:uncharacterized protein LOC122079772 isoform X1 [Macadamia integrifolia]
MRSSLLPQFSVFPRPLSNCLPQLARSFSVLEPPLPVPKRHRLMTCVRDINSLWQPLGKDTIEYFSLGDLWDQYDEWSAYGAGAPVLLKSGETVVQYYVPYLSAIQIYISKSNPKEETDVAGFESDSWSEDSESDKLSRSLSNNSSKGWDAGSEDSSFDQEGSLQMKDRLGYLYLQYFESCAPYGRVPLMDKVTALAQVYPGILSLKNVDLSPASWMAVAWYPIYHIPTRRNVRGLSACFLTYHTLSSSFQDTILEDNKETVTCSSPEDGGKSKGNDIGRISLPPFGLATYKMHGDLWVNPETADQERIISLLSAANSWLKQLRVQHHDYDYFVTHSFG